MKKITLAVLAAFTMSANALDMDSIDSKISYSIGTQIGGSLKNGVSGDVKLDKDTVFEAISDVLAGNKPQMSDEEMNDSMKKFSEMRIAADKKRTEEAATNNAEEATKFLASNKDVDGVKVTESGLQYRVITEGTGAKPTAENTVKVHYVGTLPDGVEFDSSVSRGQPAEFPLKGVIAGWTEGLQLMAVGSKYELVIPAALAYGERGPGQIGPNRALKFEVELLEIVDKEAQAKAMEAAKQAKIESMKDATKAQVKGTTDTATKTVTEKAADATKTQVKDTTETAAKTVTEKAVDATKEAATDAKNVVKEVKDAVVEKAKDAVEAVKEKAADKVTDAVEGMTEKLKNKVTD